MFLSAIGILARPTSLPTYSMCGRSNWTWNDVTNATTGKIWMDRNLGADRVATTEQDAQARGMLYQWGRLSDGHQCVNRYSGDGVTTSLTTGTQSSTDVPPTNRFIFGNYTDWRNPSNNVLWQGVNGTNNPCPTGYRLPTQAEWTNERATWSPQTLTGAFNSTRKFSAGSYRSRIDGLVKTTNDAFFWSSTFNSSGNATYIFLRNSAPPNGAEFQIDGRSTGCSVRCIKD